MMVDFSGQRALVTGAGKGIGRETVRQLVAGGAQVVGLSRSAEDLASLQRETGCAVIVADLAHMDAALAAIRDALPFELLVNNAGISQLAAVLDMTEEVFRETIDINTLAPLRIAQVVAADLIARKRPGAIVNVSSVASRIGLPLHAAYCASKAGLDALSRVLAVELGPHGIRTNSVNPTVTLTPMAERAWSDPEKAGPMQARIPLGRFVRPAEVVTGCREGTGTDSL
jgi:NAD(P)-dependent dehydrogenase (short-subunit alcohol dehydrogenase family)